MTSSSPQIVGILGGGITGLSAAYYIRKKFGAAVLPVIFEKSSKCGGWIKTVPLGADSYADTGPRSFRPVGWSGLNTLDLMEEINIADRVLFVPKSHPVARNRSIFKNGKLVRLPTELSALYQTTPPFEKPLLGAILKDLVTWKLKAKDDSVYNFIERRFGRDAAAYGIDPLTRGICAGDAKRISVKLTMAKAFEAEQKYGSVVLGYLMNKIKDYKTEHDKFFEIPGHGGIGQTNVTITSIKEHWALWGLEEGASTLVQRMEQVIEEMKIPILRNSTVNSLDINSGDELKRPITVQYRTGTDTNASYPCDLVISALPAWTLGSILRRSKPFQHKLSDLLESFEAADVVVTNVLFRDPDILPQAGFGFLVPSSEVQNTPGIAGLLGIVYDTCVFDQGDNTILTIMSQPHPASTDIISKVQEYLRLTLGIEREPDEIHTTYSFKCIPQYVVGHSEKVDIARELLKTANLPIMLTGASFEGISVNDCIYSGRRASELLPHLLKV